MAVFPLPRAPSRRAAGNRLDSSCEFARPCEMGAFSCFGVMVTAADRAAATCQRLSMIPVYKWRPEGVAGAIGKLPNGLRPPPRLRRGEILSASADTAPKRLPSQRELSCARRMTEDKPLTLSLRIAAEERTSPPSHIPRKVSPTNHPPPRQENPPHMWNPPHGTAQAAGNGSTCGTATALREGARGEALLAQKRPPPGVLLLN